MFNNKLNNYKEQVFVVEEKLIFDQLQQRFIAKNINKDAENFNDLLNDFYQESLQYLKSRYGNCRISVSLNALTSFTYKFVFQKLVENIFYAIEKEQPGATSGLGVYIYGSVARNSVPSKSDIDYFIVSNKQTEASQNLSDKVCAAIQNGLAKLGIVLDAAHMSVSLTEIEVTNKISKEELQLLVDKNILIIKNGRYTFNEKYSSFSQIEFLHDLTGINKENLYVLWREMHAYVQLFLDHQIDSVKQPFPFFHDEETAFTAVTDSWEVLNNNCEFQRWRDQEFKAYVENNRTMLIEARIQHYSGVGRDRNNYDAYQNYLFINFESTKTYTTLSKIRNQQDFLKTQILEDVFQEGSLRLLELIEKEFAVKISKAILLQIKNYFNIKIAALPAEMSARDIFNAAIKINSGLCDIFLFALGQFPFKPLQLIIQEMTKHDINKYYDYKYFEERMIGYFQRYNKDYLQEFLFDRHYFKPFQEYHKLFLAHLAEYNAGEISFSKLKEILRQEVQEKSKKFFTEKGFLFVLKEDGQRIIDTLEWLLKTEFIKEENVFLIEGLSLALRKEYLEKNEYLILKNYKRLVTFMRYYADLSSRAPLNAVAFKYLLNKFIDLHDLEVFLNKSSAELVNLSQEDFISLFKSFYEEVTRIYLKVLRKLRER